MTAEPHALPFDPIYDVSRAAVADMDLDGFLNILAKGMRDSVGADEMSILTRDAGHRWSVALTIDSVEDLSNNVHTALAAAGQRELQTAREPFLLPDTARRAHPGIASVLYCPLRTEDEWRMALIALRRAPHAPFSLADARQATIFMGFAAQAVKHARLFEQMIRRWKDLDDAHRAVERARERLLQNEELAAFGRIAVRMARELEEPIGRLGTAAGELCADEELSSSLRESLKTVRNTSLQCRRIAERLMLLQYRLRSPDYL